MFKKILLAFLGCTLLLGFFSCEQPSKAKVKEYPMFWTWIGYNAEKFDSVCQSLNELGLDGIVLKANSANEYRQAIPVANKYGLTVYAWWWTINNHKIAAEHPEWLSVNRDGYSIADSMAYVGYYKFLSPIIPGVREGICKQVEELCQIEGLEGIAIDYHRLVDVVLPTTLWPNYGIVQDR